ncbi:hypothetical protein EDC04DRAFT_2710444, partial [Pisolithus marmoratus]
MHRTARAAESDPFWGISDDIPATNTQRVRRPGRPEDLPGRYTPSNTRGFFSRTLHKLSIRGKKSDAIATAKYKNPVVVATGTSREMPQRRHVAVTQYPRTPDITDGVSDESETPSRRPSLESNVPGCSLCRMSGFFFIVAVEVKLPRANL